jgi:hypothetical protein
VYVIAWLIALAGTLRYLVYILGQPSLWATGSLKPIEDARG